MKKDTLFLALSPLNLIALAFTLFLLSSSNLFVFLILFMIAGISFVTYKFKGTEEGCNAVKVEEYEGN